MLYAVHIEADSAGFLASCPDIPEALARGATRESAVALVRQALLTTMGYYFEDRRLIPAPSAPETAPGPDTAVVALLPSVAAKVLLLNEMLLQNVAPVELAARLGTTAQQVFRLTSLRIYTKVDTIEHALAAMGKRLELRIA